MCGVCSQSSASKRRDLRTDYFAEQLVYSAGVAKRLRRNFGVKTLRTQDTSDLRHFGTIRLVPKCPDSSAPVPKCLVDSSVLVPNCLDLQQTFFAGWLNLRGEADLRIRFASSVIGQSWFDLDPQILRTRKWFMLHSVRISWHFSATAHYRATDKNIDVGLTMTTYIFWQRLHIYLFKTQWIILAYITFVITWQKQDAKLSQRDRAAGYISFGRMWKTGTGGPIQ